MNFSSIKSHLPGLMHSKKSSVDETGNIPEADESPFSKPLSTNKKVWISMLGIVLITCGIFLILFHFSELFVIIMIGFCLVFAVDKIYEIYRRLTVRFSAKIRKIIAIVVWAIILLSVLAGISYLAERINYIFMNIEYFGQMIDTGTQRLEDFISSIVGVDAVSETLDYIVSTVSEAVFESVGNFVSHGSYFLICAILLYPFMFYVYFHDSERLKKTVANAIPDKFRESFSIASSAISRDIYNYIVAKIIETIAIAIVSCIGFYIIGIDNWLLLGCLIGILNNIPYIGPIIGAIPALIVAFTINIQTVILVAVVCALGQVLDNIYLIPVVISKKVAVSSIVTVVLIVAFSKAFGMLGMILAIPVYIICRIVFIEAYRQLIRIFPSETKKATPEEENFDPIAFLEQRKEQSRKEFMKTINN